MGHEDGGGEEGVEEGEVLGVAYIFSKFGPPCKRAAKSLQRRTEILKLKERRVLVKFEKFAFLGGGISGFNSGR